MFPWQGATWEAAMPVFALVSLAPGDYLPTVWINAETELDARRLASLNLATHSGALDRAEFLCIRDKSHDPPPGVIVSDGGKTHTIERR